MKLSAASTRFTRPTKRLPLRPELLSLPRKRELERIMKILFAKSSILAALLIATAALAQNQVVLKTQLPAPLFVGTPVPLNVPNLEPPTRGKRPDFLVPAGTMNLAKNKKVTSSDNNPNVGTLDMIVDGDKDGNEGSWVELGPGKQWVQIDLARRANIYAVLVWHFHSQARVYRG